MVELASDNLSIFSIDVDVIIIIHILLVFGGAIVFVSDFHLQFTYIFIQRVLRQRLN